MSNVIKLLDLVWESANSATAHSWKLGDMAAIAGKYNFGRWCSDSTEWIYALAIETGNLTAAKSYESWKKREPFIADDVSFSAMNGFIHASHVNRHRERLAVGFEFPWGGERVEVTSFAEDGSYLTACSYKPNPKGDYSRNIAKRFRIARADILAERAERKERGILLARLTAVSDPKMAKAIKKALKAKTLMAFAAVPLEKVRQIADKYAPALPPEMLITKEHHAAARKAGCCSLKDYPVGAPLASLDDSARAWVLHRLPELYEKHFAKAGAA